MLIERPRPIAIKTLSVRTDREAFEGVHALSNTLDCSPSVLLRLAISDLLRKQARVGANNVSDLMAAN
jgi:hypothetical protein